MTRRKLAGIPARSTLERKGARAASWRCLLGLSLCAGLSALAPAWAEDVASTIPAELGTAISRTLRSIEPAGAGRYTAQNPENRIALDFDGQGLEVSPSGKPHDDWHWTLRLSGYGVPGRVKPAEKAAVVTSKQRLEYRRGAVTVWYENRPEGLEQGFTLAQPPEAQASTVELRLETGGGLKAEIEAGGKTVRFRDKSGQEVLAYRDLSVIDARGKTLPAHLALAEDQLAIEVDTRGAAWPVTVDPLIVTEEAKLTASDGAASDQFGYSVAVSGDTAVMGATGATATLGAAYVFVRDAGGIWSQQARLTAWVPSGASGFGYSVAISGDTVVIGAPDAPVSGLQWSGAAYVYVKPAGGWIDASETAKLTAWDKAAGDHFGTSVAISGDTVVIGAPQAIIGGAGHAGAAYVFVRPAGGWSSGSETAKLTALSPQSLAALGQSVAIFDGTVVAGAPGYMSDGFNKDGAVYVFVKPPSGGWADNAETARLRASELLDPGQSYLGHSVAVSADTVMAGAPSADVSGTIEAGAVYVYAKPPTGWADTDTPSARLTAEVPVVGGVLGWGALAMSGDVAVAGSVNEAAYLYRKPAGGWASGTETAKLTASDGVAGDYFGFGNSVAVSGGTVLVGAYRVTISGLFNAGAAYVYGLQPDQYSLAVTVSAGGAVTSSPAGIACAGANTCSADFAKDDAVTLTAAPTAGYAFSGWSGCDSAVGTACSVAMNQAKAVTASFVLAPPTYNLSVTKSGKGTVTSIPAGIDCGPACQGSFPQGSVVTLTATAAPKYLFIGWSGPCKQKVQGGACEVTLNKSKQVKAKFLKVLP